MLYIEDRASCSRNESSLQSISLHDLFCYTVSSSAKFEVCYEFMLLMEESVGGEGWVTEKNSLETKPELNALNEASFCGIAHLSFSSAHRYLCACLSHS